MNKTIEHPRSMGQYQTIASICVTGVPEEEKDNQAEIKYL